ncbi:MAG: hypothetical protein ACRD82_02570, partial [Blastocatellia bacterium]
MNEKYNNSPVANAIVGYGYASGQARDYLTPPAVQSGIPEQEEVDRQFSQLENQLISALEADPLEDGFSHP